MQPRIGIIDTGAANIASVAAAVTRAGAASLRVTQPDELCGVSGLIFPGVANLAFVLSQLQQRGLRDPLLLWLQSDKPFLGICAGFQALFESSDEAPGYRGLGFFSARVRRLEGAKRIHMGWNRVQACGAAQTEEWAYFAHAFAPPADFDGVIAQTSYGRTFASIARRGNVSGTQFHPERSAQFGARIFSQFLACVGTS